MSGITYALDSKNTELIDQLRIHGAVLLRIDNERGQVIYAATNKKWFQYQ